MQGNQVYGPYGNSLYSSGTMDTAKDYTGQYVDTLTGLDYYVSRYYDPVVGIFLSADVKEGNAAGMNPYAYVGGNPETMTDPSGQMIDCPDGCGGGGGNPGSGGNQGGGNSCGDYGGCGGNDPTSPPTTPQPHASGHGPTPCLPQECGNSTLTSTGTVPLAGAVLPPALIKLAQDLMQGNKRLVDDFGSNNWTVISVTQGTDVVNSDGVYTQRWYFTMNDGDGSKVVVSLNFNPTPGAQDPWDMQHLHFASDQPDPGKWGKTGYDRDVDWYDPGASENPGAEDEESDFAKLMYAFEQSTNTLEDDTLIDDATD